MFEKNRICFLLLPGFASDHSSLSDLKAKLEALGYNAVAIDFWGIEKDKDLTRLTIKDCTDAIARLTAELSEKYDYVIGVGISLGGAFLIEHAKYGNGLDYIVSVGTPFKLKNRLLIDMGLNLPFMNRIWSNILQPLSGGILPPLATSKMIIKYFETDFLKDLDCVDTSILLVHSKHDKITDYTVVADYMAKFKSPEKSLVYLEHTDHVLDYNFDVLIKNIFEVIKV